MKRAFFFFVIVFLVIATLGYIVYLVGDACYAMYRDWRLDKEVKELEALAREKRKANSEQPPSVT